MRRVVFKLFYKLGFANFLRNAKRGNLTILSLHRISPEIDFFFQPIHPKNFEELIKYVINNYTVISFAELKEIRKPLNKPPLILSFDDGYHDFIEYALPILNKYKLPSNHNIVNDCATNNSIIWTQRLNCIFNYCRNHNINLEFRFGNISYCITDYKYDWTKFYLHVFTIFLKVSRQERIQKIEEKEAFYYLDPKYRMMSWKEIIECSNNMVEIGSHTYSHDVMTSIIEEDQLIREIINSKLEIENKLQKAVNILALPNGKGNEHVNRIIEKAGFDYLLYVGDDVNKINSGQAKNLSIFKRIGISNEDPMESALRMELFHAKFR